MTTRNVDHRQPDRRDYVSPDEEVAPVDLQADPAQWFRGRTLLIVTAISVLALIITVVVCLAIWATPPMQPVQIPTVPKI